MLVHVPQLTSQLTTDRTPSDWEGLNRPHFGDRVLLVVEAQVWEAGDESLVGLLQPAHLPGELASAVQKTLLLAI